MRKPEKFASKCEFKLLPLCKHQIFTLSTSRTFVPEGVLGNNRDISFQR